MPVQYNKKDVKIETTYSDGKRPISGWTTEETMFFMENRYVVLKNFIPQEVIDMAMDVWKTIESNEDYMSAIFDLEEDIIASSPIDSLFKSHGAHTSPMGVMMHNYLTKKLKDKIDMQLQETYTYTRKYDRGAYLNAHTDRPSCEVSATFCLDYKSDDNTPWKIWVKNDKNYITDEKGIPYPHDWVVETSQGVPIRKRKETPGIKSISLEVGDLLLYQGPNVIHWRDTFVGEYSYHMFCHWYNALGRIKDIPHSTVEVGEGMPFPRSVLAYDGRKTRYDGHQERSHEYEIFAGQWPNQEWDAREFINNYNHIKRVEKK
jgi:hypothetical protein